MPDSHKTTYNSFLYILGFVLNCCFGAFYFGYIMAELNLLMVNLNKLYHWTSSEYSLFKGILNGLNPFGAIIGTLISGNFFNKISRRISLIIADVIGLIGCVICLFISANGAPQIIGRLLCGISVGINSQIIPIYINELSPIEISGVMGTFFQFFINMGILISYLMGLGIPDDSDNYDLDNSWWRFVFAFPIITCVLRIFFLLFVYTFDTPFSLIKHGKKEEMMKLLEKIYKPEYIQETLNNIENKINNYKDVSYKGLVTRYRKRLLVGLLLMITQQFSGCNAILTDSATLFNYDGDSQKVKIYTIIISLCLLVSAMLSGKLSDKYGRRTLLLFGNGTCAIILIAMGILEQPQFNANSFKEASIYLTFVFVFMYGLSLAPICWVYEPEILPEKGVSLAVITNWLFCLLIVFLTPVLIDMIDISPLYYFFGCYLLLSHVQMYFTLKETKGKTNKEIDLLFDGRVVEDHEEDDKTIATNAPQHSDILLNHSHEYSG